MAIKNEQTLADQYEVITAIGDTSFSLTANNLDLTNNTVGIDPSKVLEINSTASASGTNGQYTTNGYSVTQDNKYQLVIEYLDPRSNDVETDHYEVTAPTGNQTDTTDAFVNQISSVSTEYTASNQAGELRITESPSGDLNAGEIHIWQIRLFESEQTELVNLLDGTSITVNTSHSDPVGQDYQLERLRTTSESNFIGTESSGNTYQVVKVVFKDDKEMETPSDKEGALTKTHVFFIQDGITNFTYINTAFQQLDGLLTDNTGSALDVGDISDATSVSQNNTVPAGFKSVTIGTLGTDATADYLALSDSYQVGDIVTIDTSSASGSDDVDLRDEGGSDIGINITNGNTTTVKKFGNGNTDWTTT